MSNPWTWFLKESLQNYSKISVFFQKTSQKSSRKEILGELLQELLVGFLKFSNIFLENFLPVLLRESLGEFLKKKILQKKIINEFIKHSVQYFKTHFFVKLLKKSFLQSLKKISECVLVRFCKRVRVGITSGISERMLKEVEWTSVNIAKKNLKT